MILGTALLIGLALQHSGTPPLLWESHSDMSGNASDGIAMTRLTIHFSLVVLALMAITGLVLSVLPEHEKTNT